MSNPVDLYKRTIIGARASGVDIVIGNNVSIIGVTIYARRRIENGNNICIGGKCKILDSDFCPIAARNKLLQDENGGDLISLYP